MKILFLICHPAHVHQFKYLIKDLKKEGHKIKVLALKKDNNTYLLKQYNIKYTQIFNNTGNNILEKIFITISTTYKINKICNKFKPDFLIDRGSPMMAFNGFICRIKHIVYDDNDFQNFSLNINKLFSWKIITPTYFKKDLGKKQIRIDTLKELSYLHPKYFKPNKKIPTKYKINLNKSYIIVRFVAWKASHDTGIKHMKLKEKYKLVKKISKFTKVYISTESKLPKQFNEYLLKIKPEDIHHIMYYSSILISEGATMATEATLLGIPTIYFNPIDYSIANKLEKNTKIFFRYKTNQSKNIINKVKKILQTDYTINKEVFRKKISNQFIDINTLINKLIN